MTKINNKTVQKSMSVKTEKGQKTSNVKSTLIKMIDKINILLAELATKKDVQATTGRDKRETSLQILALLKQQ